MNTLNQLLRAIITNPEADDPRLQYADALEELPSQTTTRKCTMCVDGKQNDCEIGDLHYNEWDCESCLGTGRIVIPDTINQDRAAFIREQIEHPILVGSDLKAYSQHQRALWSTVYSVQCSRLGEWWIWFGNGVDRFGRGFLERIECPAAEFLKHADELIWHPKQTVPAPRCEACGGALREDRGRWKDKHDHDYWIRCGVCKGVDEIPRPCPDTAQPITKVVLTTDPRDIEGWDEGQFRSVLRAEDGRQIWRCGKWPGIEFIFPDVQ